MLLQASRTKFRKYKKVKVRKQKKNRILSVSLHKRLNFGTVGLKSIESCRISARQIESARKVIRKGLNKLGCFWIIPFPDFPVTKKSLGVRMGKGKGSVTFWVCRLLEGDVLFEVSGISVDQASRILKKASKKLPVKTSLVNRLGISI
jgi:large subunit ribosomal protein L16